MIKELFKVIKKIALSSLIALLIAAIVLIIWYGAFMMLGGLFLGGVFEPAMTPDIAQSDYDEYREQFAAVAQYVEDNDIDELYITEYADIDMSYDNAAEAAERLIDAGYETIGIEKNTLYFQKYATLDCGKGIMYSIDGGAPYMQFLTYQETLSEQDWYYYEDDYNEWRERN